MQKKYTIFSFFRQLLYAVIFALMHNHRHTVHGNIRYDRTDDGYQGNGRAAGDEAAGYLLLRQHEPETPQGISRSVYLTGIQA